ncbi:hypothetical protein HUT16_02950 [Kitasatospora sp. NA04385]|uniref:hypothetical protein n=1 Tax=Kitasatospora sp. NA04385 TaxID=2742135 RepID=UPI0015915520|nr:hypothetical protein [Kitasatospora sp. NA04385]QKW18159.1 hypothetical protein HUT16_02950 [Kitasatospora sp. NA04385]
MPEQLSLGGERRLVLRDRQLTDRLGALFEEIDRDESLQQAFIESPAEVVSAADAGSRQVTPGQASAVNRFLFSALASDGLRDWAAGYDREHPDSSQEERLRHFAEALATHADPTLMGGLLELAGSDLALDMPNAALIIKHDSVAIGNWFIVKVSGSLEAGKEVLPADQVQRLAQQLVARAQELSEAGQL